MNTHSDKETWNQKVHYHWQYINIKWVVKIEFETFIWFHFLTKTFAISYTVYDIHYTVESIWYRLYHTDNIMRHLSLTVVECYKCVKRKVWKRLLKSGINAQCDRPQHKLWNLTLKARAWLLLWPQRNFLRIPVWNEFEETIC